MANLEVKNPPEFTNEIYKTEREDLLTAELENEIKGKLLNNDVFLKQELLEENKRAKAAEETNKNNLANHVTDKVNPHKVTKAQVGLENVDNTADVNKPVSTAQQNALDASYRQATGYTDQKIADLIGGAPETLDTLKEVADAIQANKDVSTALDTAIGTKADKTVLDTHTGNNTIHITSQERTNWNDANTKKHTHSNKSVLDKITQALLDSWNAAYSHISDAVKHITATERTLWNTVSNKVDKVSGKGLSTNDYTTAEKNKLAGIAAGANKITIDSALSDSSINPVQNKIVKSALDGKAASSHIHNYAGSTSAGGSANSAVKLDSSAGSAEQPVYFKDGKPATCTYSLNASVPSGAKFTDTTYSNMTAATASAAGKAGLVPAPAAGKQASFLRGDGTWATPTDTNTWRGITDSLTSTSTTTSLSAKAGKSLKDSIDIINNNLKQNTTGKFILPNGLKICWGKSKPPNTNGYIRSTVVNFPVTFNAVPVVCVTKLVSNSYTECGVTSAVGTITEKQFNIKAMYQETALSDLEVELQWIAIGY